MIRYEVEGETNLPFNLTKIIVVSTVDGLPHEEAGLSVAQSNDIYIHIEKNEDYSKEELITSITIDNIKVNTPPQMGNIVFYKPSNLDNSTYIYDKQFEINNKIDYIGEETTNLKTLSIANQGGTIAFRVSNQDITTYITDEAVSIINDSSLLNKIEINAKEIEFKISFDILIITGSNIAYKGTVHINLPLSNLQDERVVGVELPNVHDIVFKRVPSNLL